MTSAPALHRVRCDACRHDVLKVQTPRGDELVVNAEPSPNGTIALYTSGTVTVGSIVTGPRRDGMRAARVPLYQSHSIDCVGKGRK